MVSGKLEELYEEHFIGVQRYFVRQFGRHFDDAEDLAQEVFYRMFNHVKIYGDRDTNRFYLYKIAQNVKYDYIKRRANSATVNIDDLTIRAFCDIEEEVNIGYALHSLSQEEKTLLAMTVQDDRSHEIAAVLGVAPSTVRARIKMLRRKLQKLLE